MLMNFRCVDNASIKGPNDPHFEAQIYKEKRYQAKKPIVLNYIEAFAEYSIYPQVGKAISV